MPHPRPLPPLRPQQGPLKTQLLLLAYQRLSSSCRCHSGRQWWYEGAPSASGCCCCHRYACAPPSVSPSASCAATFWLGSSPARAKLVMHSPGPSASQLPGQIRTTRCSSAAAAAAAAAAPMHCQLLSPPQPPVPPHTGTAGPASVPPGPSE